MGIDGISFFNMPDLQLSQNSTAVNPTNFNDFLKDALDKVNQKQIDADTATQSLITGDAQDIHQVLLATEEAKLSLELASQIRTKLVDAYQEITRIQI